VVFSYGKTPITGVFIVFAFLQIFFQLILGLL